MDLRGSRKSSKLKKETIRREATNIVALSCSRVKKGYGKYEEYIEQGLQGHSIIGPCPCPERPSIPLFRDIFDH